MLSLVSISGNAMPTRSDRPEAAQEIPERSTSAETVSLDHQNKGSVSVADPRVEPAKSANLGPEITIDAAVNDPYRVTAEDLDETDVEVPGNGEVEKPMTVAEIVPDKNSG